MPRSEGSLVETEWNREQTLSYHLSNSGRARESTWPYPPSHWQKGMEPQQSPEVAAGAVPRGETDLSGKRDCEYILGKESLKGEDTQTPVVFTPKLQLGPWRPTLGHT